MGLSFRVAASLKGLKKKKKMMKRSKVGGGARRNKRAVFKPSLASFPEDVLMEILARLPADSLMMFKCVSKLWFSLISCRYFTNLFLKYTWPLRQRRMFMYLVDKDGHGECALLSVSPLDKLDNFCILYEDVTKPAMGGCFVNGLRGLMCFRIGTRVRICNLTTKQHVELPPLVRWNDESHIWNHFGHDPVQDEYKVLSLVWEMSKEESRVVRSEHQVLVLGPGACWRSIQSIAPHRPYSQGISIQGVLYYGAWTGEHNTCVVVSFDMRLEELNLIELPIDAGIIWDTRVTNLMNYKDQLAVFDYSRLATEHSMDMWVVQDLGKRSRWSNKKTFVLPIPYIRLILEGDALLMMHGSSREGELRVFDKNDPRKHVICDLDKSKIIGEAIVPLRHRSSFETESLHMSYWDEYFESIMYLEA